MPLMRDAQTGVIREVDERYLKRWPLDYLPIETPAPTGEEQAPARVLVKPTGGRKKEKS